MGKNEIKVLTYLKELLNSVNGKTEEERLLKLLNGGLNYTRLRNAIIIAEFDKRSDDTPVMRLYNDLANEYYVSNDTIRTIIRHRELNEVLLTPITN